MKCTDLSKIINKWIYNYYKNNNKYMNYQMSYQI